MAARDGDGWVRCSCGRTHWGVNGAAGLLLVRTDGDQPRILLQLRAEWTHGGGTWALPGGAIDSHEDSATAAAREAREEAGVDGSRIEVRLTHRAACANDDWFYDTVIAHCDGDAGAHVANAESVDLDWVAIDEVDRRPLHGGFAAAWPVLRQKVLDSLA